MGYLTHLKNILCVFIIFVLIQNNMVQFGQKMVFLITYFQVNFFNVQVRKNAFRTQNVWLKSSNLTGSAYASDRLLYFV